MSNTDHQSTPGAVVEETKPRTKQPPQYKVVMMNDDFTPMEFVVQVLQQFFHHTRESAVQIMLHIHTKGRGVAGVYPAELAETKTAQVNSYAREHQHPLLTVMEKA
ncbi:MAG: ATP-dependent Clp protease adapter ClpS [Panacagrimonas sp.]